MPTWLANTAAELCAQKVAAIIENVE
jgi:hypothetical protein